MLIQEKKYNDYLAHDYEPIDETKMPYLVDLHAIKAYADSKGMSIISLSEEEKKQFLRPNPAYKKSSKLGIVAAF